MDTVTARDGTKHIAGWHEWLSTSPPYNNRIIEFANGRVLWEQAFDNGRLDLYDPARNTIYMAPKVADSQVVGCSRCSGDTPQSTSALSVVAYLLKQPNVNINRDATLHGRPASKISFDRGRFSYWITPGTYQPLHSEDRADSLPDGQRGVDIARFPVQRVLTGSAASPRLLSLHAQHPGATVDRKPADYAAADRRLIHLAGSRS